ncbi:MAG: polyprenyl diphosphate synthase [Nitrospirota bacterium]|uniref:Isoprenyl transferase n=1 Tax=Candidatus Magnetominusculus xianensis TaxID=1748249 RepID=A0ABR5SI11_9BACT|nr:polyprenyl diphosphate synthase [Candidatus Magnetominusculus xianensis]KWT91870.1 UDP pyrophosphate synthase [Candidatus Magnetominusculus xianensis]
MTDHTIPKHVGIIMDGNGRWANQRGMPRVEGHRKGAGRTKEIIEAAADLGIKTLTLYAFSIENWKRPHDEVITLMDLLDFYLKTEIEDLLNKGLVFKVIGNKEKLPDNIQYLVEEAERITGSNTGMNLMMAISYGGRDEIVRAVKRFIEKGGDMDEVNEESFEENLDTGGVTPVDLIIRTGGEKRISNFLVWQAAYAELFFTDTLWPDFTKEEFIYAIEDYKLRQRRFGMIPDKAET